VLYEMLKYKELVIARYLLLPVWIRVKR